MRGELNERRGKRRGVAKKNDVMVYNLKKEPKNIYIKY